MKKFKQILWLVALLMFFSCEKDLHTYEGKPAIYMNEVGRLPAFSGELIKDSTIVSFSLSKSQDSIVRMIIRAISKPADFDRTYDLKVSSLSDAKEGVHYKIMNPDYVIRKGELSDTVFIKLFRTAEMKDKNFLLSFNLFENENFSTPFNFKVLNSSTGQRLNYVGYKWYINDIIKKPGRWLDYYTGVFSRKKLYLMMDILGVDPSYMDTSISIAELAAYGKYMQRYLNQQKAAGNTIYEEDGITEMYMGDGSQ